MIKKFQDKELKDIKNNKKKNWKDYKMNNVELAESFERIFEDTECTKPKRCLDCGTELVFKKLDDDKLTLYSANFCKIRLCPMCSWRKSLKMFGQVSKILSEIEKEKEYNYLFLTLTIKNSNPDELKDNISHILKSFKRMTRYKKFDDVVIGYFRSLEVTYNQQTNEFHPHLHVLLTINKSYFNGRKYIKQKDWVALWKRALNIDYEPVVDIRTVKNDNSKAIAEVSKYAVKASDIVIKDKNGIIDTNMTDYVVKALDEALAHRRLVSFGGLMKTIHNKLNFDDLENGDLINTDIEDDTIRQDVFELVTYIWDNKYKNYYKK